MDNLVITDTGVVSVKIKDIFIQNIYSFVHDSNFNHFDNQSAIVKTSNTRFLQTYAHLDKIVKLEHVLNISDNELQWMITRLYIPEEEYVPYTFGITIPGKSLYSEEGDTNNIVNYSQHWIYNWENQTNSNIPIVRCDDVYISVPVNNNVQFILFTGFLKISTLRNDDLNLTVKISPAIEDMKTSYSLLYPEAKEFISKWELIFRKVKRKYGITIHLDPDVIDIYKCANAIEKTLSCYNIRFLNEINMKDISLCVNIQNNEHIVRGHKHKDGVLLNSELSEIELQLALHHEIFHFINPNEELATHYANFAIDPSSVPATDATWNKLKNILEQYNPLTVLKHSINTELVNINETYHKTSCRLPKKIYGTSILPCELNIPGIIKFTCPEPNDCVVCFTINPLDYCVVNKQISAQNSIDNWIQFHISLPKNTHFFHIERIIKEQWADVNYFFAGLGLVVEVSHLEGFKSYARNEPYCVVPYLGNCWESAKNHPIFRKIGYHELSVYE